MKIDDLLDLSLREVLENYSALISLECGYFYGIAPDGVIEKMYKEYDIKADDNVSIAADTIVNDELVIDGSVDLIDDEKVCRIMSNLGIKKKGDK